MTRKVPSAFQHVLLPGAPHGAQSSAPIPLAGRELATPCVPVVRGGGADDPSGSIEVVPKAVEVVAQTVESQAAAEEEDEGGGGRDDWLLVARRQMDTRAWKDVCTV